MSTTLPKKLRLQEGFKALVLNPPENYFELLGSLPENVDEEGIRPVTQVSIDATWSALRFRPTAEVGKKKSRS